MADNKIPTTGSGFVMPTGLVWGLILLILLPVGLVGFAGVYGVWSLVFNAKAGMIPVWAVLLIIGLILYWRR